MVLADQFLSMTPVGTGTMRHLTETSDALDRSVAVSWLRGKLHLDEAKPTFEPAVTKPISWQDVHRQDTSWLAQRHDWRQTGGRERTGSSVPETLLDTSELGWVRQNAARVYLLRTGQWQPVPTSPPDCWIECLATDTSGVMSASL
jgi:hypothetical protein